MYNISKGRKMKLDIRIILLILVAGLNGIYAVYNYTEETEIRKQIFHESIYDPVSRPSSQTHVKIGLNVLAIDSLDLKGQRLTMAGWISLIWEDQRLTWDKNLHGDMEYVFTKPEKIWRPEIIVDNALEDFDIIHSDELLLRLHYDGVVDWEPPRLLTTHCEVDITYYPYDEQKCNVQVVSWSYTIDEVDLQHLFENVNLEDFEIHGEWDILQTRIEDRNLTEHMPDGTVRIYPELDFWLYLQRRTDFYNLNVMLPIILMSVMVVFVFIVPVESGEKLTYVLTVFLSLSVLLTIVAESLPPTSITISVLGLYLGIVLLLTALGILLTTLILLLFHKEGRPDKNSIILALTHRAAKIICWRNHYLMTKKALEENKVVPIEIIPCDEKQTPVKKKTPLEKKTPVENKTPLEIRSRLEKKTPLETPGKKTNEKQVNDTIDYAHDHEENGFLWKDVAMVLDRLCFFVFFVITLFMNLGFIIAFSGIGKSGIEHSASNGHH